MDLSQAERGKVGMLGALHWSARGASIRSPALILAPTFPAGILKPNFTLERHSLGDALTLNIEFHESLDVALRFRTTIVLRDSIPPSCCSVESNPLRDPGPIDRTDYGGRTTRFGAT